MIDAGVKFLEVSGRLEYLAPGPDEAHRDNSSIIVCPVDHCKGRKLTSIWIRPIHFIETTSLGNRRHQPRFSLHHDALLSHVMPFEQRDQIRLCCGANIITLFVEGAPYRH